MLHDRKALFSAFSDLGWYGILFFVLLLGGIMLFMASNALQNSVMGDHIYWEPEYLSLAFAEYPVYVSGSESVRLADYLMQDTIDRSLLEEVTEEFIASIHVERGLSKNVFIIKNLELLTCEYESGRLGPGTFSSPCQTTGLGDGVRPRITRTNLYRSLNELGSPVLALERFHRHSGNRNAPGMSWVAVTDTIFVGVALRR